MIHTMEAERPAGGRERLPRMILWVYAGDTTGQGLGVKREAAPLADVAGGESWGGAPGFCLGWLYGAIPEHHLPEGSWLLFVLFKVDQIITTINFGLSA